MKHIIDDGGRLGYAPHERLDCTVRAVALAAGLSYGAAHALLKAHGRKDGHKMKDFVGFMKRAFPEVRRAGDCGITVGRYVQHHANGTYLLLVRGHAFAVVDGVVVDNTTPHWRQKVRGAWCFKEGV